MSRMSASPIRLAIAPPDASTPQLPRAYPTRSQSQAAISSSTKGPVIPESHRSMPWLVQAVRISPAMAGGSDGGAKHEEEPGGGAVEVNGASRSRDPLRPAAAGP